MAESLNTVALVGRLGRDPELRSTAGGTAVCNLSLAVDGRGEDAVSWIEVTLFGKSAEAAAEHLAKGRRIGVQGRLEQRRWQAQDGTNREKVGVVADRFQFLDSREAGAAQGSDMAPGPVGGGGSTNAPGEDDDIPFAASWV